MDVLEYIELKLSHSVHTSGRKSFDGCRRRWDWIYNGHYYPLVTAKPLEFGVAFHAAMEKFYDPLTWHDKTVAGALALGMFSQTIDKQYFEFRRKNPELVTEETKADYSERKALGLEMLRYYIDHVSALADHNLTPLKVEVEFEVPIVGPNGETIWCKCDRCWEKWCNYVDSTLEKDTSGWIPLDQQPGERELWKGLPVSYGGRIDALMQDDLGRYWIYDWKTAATMSANEDFLWIESQITSYLWALWSIGISVVGFIYAEIRKAAPSEPEPLSRPYKGKMYSTNKNNATTLEMFERTVKENDALAYHNGLYDDYISHLKGPEAPKFHQRFQISRNTTELYNAGIDIYNQALDMMDPNVRIYPAPGKFGCKTCAFYDPCLGKNRGEDYLYTLNTMFEKRPRHYYEQPRSTDTRGGE